MCLLLGSASWEPNQRNLAYLADIFETLNTLIMKIYKINIRLISQYFMCQEIIAKCIYRCVISVLKFSF